MSDYLPRFRSGHVMTLAPRVLSRAFPRLPPATSRYFDVSSDARVLAHCHWQREPTAHPTVVALHGLEGSSDSHYMRGVADKAFTHGFNVVRLNQRNCGGTEQLSVGLYHSGLSDDPEAVIRELIDLDRLPSIAVVGYSLGGNLALRLAGVYGASAPAQLRSVCAISPTIDLRRCVAALERRENSLYEWNFVNSLKRRMRRKARLFPGRYDVGGLRRVQTVRQFDERFTAPHHAFRDADDYYYRASAMRVIDAIRTPSLIITAADDPFVPADQFNEPAIVQNPCISVLVTAHGGHCAFMDSPQNGHDGYWAERKAIEFVAQRFDKEPVKR